MKIQRRKTAYRKDSLPPLPFVAGEYCCKINLANYFEKSIVEQIWLREKAVVDINQWVSRSLDTLPVPEVGGFLLGNYESESSTLAIDHFLPAAAIEYNSPIRLDFSVKDILALDLALESFPQWKLVGWFHTHPGHSPYLSDTDLATHLGFFREEYMFAIVLDCLTQEYDTGLFGRKPDGIMNNKEDAGPWFSWKKISIPCDA